MRGGGITRNIMAHYLQILNNNPFPNLALTFPVKNILNQVGSKKFETKQKNSGSTSALLSLFLVIQTKTSKTLSLTFTPTSP